MHFRKEDDENYAMDLTSLIDVVFLLLIFFMVSTAFVDFTRRMDISLPQSNSAVPDETPKVFHVEMTVDKQVFVNGKKMTAPEIESALATAPQDEKKTAIIKADKDLPYGNVIQIMGILQAGRVRDISVAVK
ncbi:MAG: biopolymer transporter ExbD [Nitrospinae bacterium]|nr:biopolymer transporter ExbD [Nitrospinota bacterium]